MLNIDDRLIKEVSPKIGPNALSVLLAIAIHLNQKTDRAFPSHFRLMELTGMGKNAVYDALKVLKKEGLLKSEQAINSKTKKFGRRVFRLTTSFISIFVTAENAEPLPDYREPENREPENREPENRETYHINKGEQINKSEQINNEDERARADFSPLNTEQEKPLPPSSAAPPSPTDTALTTDPAELEMLLRTYYKARPEDWKAVKERLDRAAAAAGLSYDSGKVSAIVSRYCDWTITKGHTGWTYSQHNARLRTWMADQPSKEYQTTSTTRQQGTAPAVGMRKGVPVYGS